MRLKKVQIKEFRSIQDSTEVEVGAVTCLVGKNESGKTTFLQALYRLNPVNEQDGNFDVTDDYPRHAAVNYKGEVQDGRREPAHVIHATYALEQQDTSAVEDVFGNCLKADQPVLFLHKGYSNSIEIGDFEVDETAAIKHIVETAGLSQSLLDDLHARDSIDGMLQVADQVEQSEPMISLTTTLRKISESGLASVIFEDVLKDRVPKFLYFDEYYQMKGQDNIEALQHRRQQNNLNNSDYPLLGLIELAGLNLSELINPQRTEGLIGNLEAAENQLTQTALKYWSQNRHLRMKFDVRPGQLEDPGGMNSGMNILGRVHDTKHMVSTALGKRSRGFVWFFSFLAWYSQLRRKNQNLILLLDEPGLSLHAKAQADLLRYFEEELKPNHQLIYTTHSPFMVDPMNFDRVRIVQDLSIERESDELSEEKQGTQVITEVLDATTDSLFPLQGALGYEIHQTLFVGPNSLVVEGVSDLLYLQTMSALLQDMGKTGLRAEWTVTPVGGLDKVATFVALLGSQNNLNVAVLIDYQRKDHQTIEKLYKRKLLAQQKVITYEQFTENGEADIEDMFQPKFYLHLVNSEYGCDIDSTALPSTHPRIVRRLEEYWTSLPNFNDVNFNHFRPARYFTEHVGSLNERLSNDEIDRFEALFEKVNGLL